MLKSIINKLLRPKSDALSFKQGLDLTDLPIVTFQQGDQKLNFLLDTGSNNNIIHSKVLDKIQYTPTNVSSDLFGVEGNKQEVKFCKITISYKDSNFEYDYAICDMTQAFDTIKNESGVNLHGIIGSKFFCKFQYVLDFKELIAYSKR